MRQITFLTSGDAALMETCILGALGTWKAWVEKGEIPEGWTIESALAIIEQLVGLKEKITNINNSFDSLLTEDIRAEVEQAAREQGYGDTQGPPIPQNILNFPTSEAE